MPQRIYDWNAVQAYYDEGHGYAECARRFGFTYHGWSKALNRGRLRLAPSRFDDRRRRHDWGAIQAYYDAGASLRDCKVKFCFCTAAWTKAVRRGEIKPRPQHMPLEKLLRDGKSRYNIKHRLMRAGLLQNRCEQCGLSEWRGKPLIAHIDHINGIKNDHRLENLRMLCPNCHSQTETYSGHNVKRRRHLQDPAEFV
jgi:5-methylcytosine-specific restriction endonuclease McrA